ncbi:MAG: CopG family transcriptional regulator [Hyphomicrobiales bacterium]|nr:CopG family transcriptional regulator [Hyphomicrobiales bacterium]
MKTAISIPDPVFDAADKLADRLGLSRSALYAQAVAELLERHRSFGVTERLNEVYAEVPSGMDPVLHRMQLASLPYEEW